MPSNEQNIVRIPSFMFSLLRLLFAISKAVHFGIAFVVLYVFFSQELQLFF